MNEQTKKDVLKLLDELVNGTWLDDVGLNHNDNSLADLAERSNDGHTAKNLLQYRQKAVKLMLQIRKIPKCTYPF